MTAGRDARAAGAVGERERLLVAVLEVVVECGYAGTTAEAVCEQADVPMPSFTESFGDVQGCVTAAYEEITDRFDGQVLPAYEAEPRWRDALRSAAYAAADFFAEHPSEVRFCTIAFSRRGICWPPGATPTCSASST